MGSFYIRWAEDSSSGGKLECNVGVVNICPKYVLPACYQKMEPFPASDQPASQDGCDVWLPEFLGGSAG